VLGRSKVFALLYQLPVALGHHSAGKTGSSPTSLMSKFLFAVFAPRVYFALLDLSPECEAEVLASILEDAMVLSNTRVASDADWLSSETFSSKYPINEKSSADRGTTGPRGRALGRGTFWIRDLLETVFQTHLVDLVELACRPPIVRPFLHWIETWMTEMFGHPWLSLYFPKPLSST